MESHPSNAKPPAAQPPKSGGKRKLVPFTRFFKHHVTGVVYDAWEYGHKAWPIGKRAA